MVTVIGTNDAPVFLCGPDTEHLTGGPELSPSGELHADGDLFFGDIDLSDAHTVSTTVTAARSGGGAIPLSNAALLAAFDDVIGSEFHRASASARSTGISPCRTTRRAFFRRARH